MRRIASWLIMVPALVAVVVFALNNKTPVALDLWPFGFLVEMPTYLALFLALGLGVVVGGVVAWISQGRTRSSLRDEAYEGEVARRELRAEKERVRELEAELARKSDAGNDGNARTVAAVKTEPQHVTLPPPAA